MVHMGSSRQPLPPLSQRFHKPPTPPVRTRPPALTDQKFGSASAFSVHVKRQVTPSKQGDDGWRSVHAGGVSLHDLRAQLVQVGVQRVCDLAQCSLLTAARQPAYTPGACRCMTCVRSCCRWVLMIWVLRCAARVLAAQQLACRCTVCVHSWRRWVRSELGPGYCSVQAAAQP